MLPYISKQGLWHPLRRAILGWEGLMLAVEDKRASLASRHPQSGPAPWKVIWIAQFIVVVDVALLRIPGETR